MQQITTPPLAEGETYIGLIGAANGDAYHVILLPGDNNNATWQQQMDWANSIGGDLPNRIEQAMLWANHRDQFQEDAYWSNETHNSDSGYAWTQHFDHGYQHYYHKLHEFRARAVRRLPL